MQTVRIFFSKQDEAAYISHLDLQRVMSRAIRRSGFPAWYSQGFNPHVYMSFSLPLPLYQESVVESVDCKTEQEDLAALQPYVAALNEALPGGIRVQKIQAPVHKAGEIQKAAYEFTGDAALAGAAARYNAAESAMVVRKTKRSETQIDLKTFVPTLEPLGENSFRAVLPAGSENTINAALLLQFMSGQGWLDAEGVAIKRVAVYTADGEEFC